MIFDYKYKGQSQVNNTNNQSQMTFVPDASRDPTFFNGRLAPQHAVLFREAISTLHKVVTDDQRYQAPDNTDYLLWRKEQDILEFQRLLAIELGLDPDLVTDTNFEAQVRNKKATVESRMQALSQRQHSLREEINVIAPKLKDKGYYQALGKYYNWLYKANYAAWVVLDPVITVHPDSLFFECFSLDESSYGKLSCDYENFEDIGQFSCGTTNIDYSHALYTEFQKIRDYKETRLTVDPEGFTVATSGEDDFREVKIDLPDSWVRGFLQVSSAMALPAQVVRMDPMDVHAICLFLRKHKELHGPRSLRFQLSATGQVTVQVDPWGTKIECKKSKYYGSEAQEIRIWGRRRLYILERLIPIAKHFDLYLLGEGLPYFFVADLNGLRFTLGLSGWSGNNFSQGANFDLLAPRNDVSEADKARVFYALKSQWSSTPEKLAKSLKMDISSVTSALTSYIQAGRVVFDLQKNIYRARELSREALPADALRFTSPQEEKAMEILNTNRIGNIQSQTENDKTFLSTTVLGKRGGSYTPHLCLDPDGRIRNSETKCNCEHYYSGQHKSGPCEHVLALRLQYRRQVTRG